MLDMMHDFTVGKRFVALTLFCTEIVKLLCPITLQCCSEDYWCNVRC